MTQPDSAHASRYSAAEWQMRTDLAACYRAASLYGFSDVVWNHITAKVPGTENFLINRFGLRFDEVTASNLVTLDIDGNLVDPGTADSEEDINVTGFVIHSAIHMRRPDVHCIMHSHSEAGLAVSALKDGLVPMVQDAMPFYKRTAYHDYEGLSTDTDERERLADNLGEFKAMIMRNHGLVTCGESVGEAFMLMYYLERACKVQMQVMATGQPITIPPHEVCEKARDSYDLFPLGQYEWPAIVRQVENESPGFRD